MAGLMSKTTLMHILAGGADIDGFKNASTVAHNALGAFEVPVWCAVKNRTAWTGVGQDAAEQVMHGNALALEVTRAQMESASAALAGACNVFVTCGSNLDRVNDYAKSKGCWINEDGTVVWDDNNPNKPDPVATTALRMQVNIEFSVANILKLATAADRSAKASLELVRDNVPQITDTASDLILEHNKDALHQALEDRQTILEVAAGWMLVDDSSLVTAYDIATAYAVNADIEQQLTGQGIDLSEELNLLLEGAEIWEPARYLSALRGDLPGLISTSIVDGLKGLSTTATSAELAADAAKAARLGGRLVTGIGVAMFLGDLAAWGLGKLAPDAEPTTFTVASGDAEAKAEVHDQDLADIAAKFYPRGGETIADLAREQRLEGVVEGDPERNWVNEAKDLRDELTRWLAKDEDPDPQDPDRAYADGLIEELDSSVGPYQ